MHIFFSGIGGTAIGPLALLASQAGYAVSGSDKQNSSYISYLQKQGLSDIHIGQDRDQIAKIHEKNPIDWYVYSSAVAIENPNAPELLFCKENTIRMSKRDELLNEILSQKNLKLVAVAGTHGKTTTTAMLVWLCKQLNMPVSYTLAAKSSFADLAEYNEKSQYFIYECDEFDRNFLHFQPHLSLITGIDWDHPDIFPTRQAYVQAFEDFIDQSKQTILWQQDARQLSQLDTETTHVLQEQSAYIKDIALAGEVNRRNAWQVANAAQALTKQPAVDLAQQMDQFPGVSRRFERIADNMYTDYAHTPPKIRGALQLGHEIAGERLVVVYEGLHNTRQHFIRDELVHIFDTVKKLFIVPSYLAREDESLELLTPSKLRDVLSEAAQEKTVPSMLDHHLEATLKEHIAQGDTVLCLSAGGGNSLDEWLRATF